MLTPPSLDQPVDPAGSAGQGGNLAELVRRAADRSPDATAFVSGAARVTWAEVDASVDLVAAALRGLGLTPGDRVALCLPNTVDFPIVYFGVLRADLVALPVNTGYTAAEASYLLRDSGAGVVIASPDLAGTFLEVAAGSDTPTTVLVTGPDEPPAGARSLRALGADAPSPPEPSRGGEDLAVLLYTSGTSGRPKGAMLTHRALLADLDHVSSIDPPVARAGDVVLLVLPLFHVFGLNTGLGMVARHGATGVLVERFDPVETLAQIRRHRVSLIVGAPPMYVAWSMLPTAADSFSAVRLAISGSAPLPGEVLERLREVTGRPVFEGYGLTETAPTVTSTLMSAVAKPGSIGRPVPGVQIRLLDEEGDEVDADDPGEIVVRGANLFSGYWPDGTDGPDDDGWFRTGDVAYADEDTDLHLVDRRRELILVSGFNVYPREVEAVLLTHPGVAEAAVIGIPHPYTGESVKALVVPRGDARPAAAELIRHCAQVLARFKCPTAVELVDELPYTATGKVSKGRLRDALTAQ